MEQIEQDFFDVCQMYNNPENNDFKGALLFESFKNAKLNEELLASYVNIKEKFDCLYAFLVTRTRILEISVYSTMCITQSKRFKEIKKILVEKAFDEQEIQKIITDEVLPERVQLKISFVDFTNQTEDVSLENIEKREDIAQALEFAKMLSKLQTEA
jgi:hypothetical protein